MRKQFDFYDMLYMLQRNIEMEIALVLDDAGVDSVLLEEPVAVTITSDELYDTDVSKVSYDIDKGLRFYGEDNTEYDIYDMTVQSAIDIYKELGYACNKLSNKKEDDARCRKSYS